MIKDCNLKTAENRHPAKNGRENRAQTDQWDSERGETIAARVEHHADAILRAYDTHREVPCPRCHETCGWCSDYRFMHGTLRIPGTRRKCTIAAYHPDECCPLCGGTKRVWMTVTYSASYRAGEVGK